MEKIAVWGFGKRGRRIFNMFGSGWKDRYAVNAVFDARWRELRDEGAEFVRDPAELREADRNGEFSSVLLCAGRPSVGKELRNELKKLRVPEAKPDNAEFFRPVSLFEHAVSDLSFDRDGYRLDVLKDMYLARPFNTWSCFYFDRGGYLLQNKWYAEMEFIQHPENRWYRPPAEIGEPISLEGDCCHLAFIYSGNYWHFLYESMDLCYLMEEQGYRGRYIVPDQPFVKPLMNLMGVADDRLLKITDLRPDRIYQSERLYVPALDSMRFRNPEKTAVLLEAAERILAALPDPGPITPAGPDGSRRVFIRRITNRILEGNEDILKEAGFVTVTPEDLTPEEQIQLFRHADIVISPHGANTSNILFMRPGSALIETFPVNYINPCCTEEALMKGVHYFIAVEDAEDCFRSANEDAAPEGGQLAVLEQQQRNYRIAPDVLRLMIRKAEAAVHSGE